MRPFFRAIAIMIIVYLTLKVLEDYGFKDVDQKIKERIQKELAPEVKQA